MADSSSTSNSNVGPARLLSKAIGFLILLALLDFVAGAMLGRLFGMTSDGDFGGCVNRVLEQRSDIVVFGSSRAKSHYDPAILSAETGMSVFNAGVAAQHLLFHYCLEQLMFDRYQPKAIVLDFNTEDLRARTDREPYEKLAVLLPFFKLGNPRVNATLLQRSPYESLKLLARTYPYNSQLLPILKYALNTIRHGKGNSNGYYPYIGSSIAEIERVLKERPAQTSHAQDRTDPAFVDVLRQFILDARNRNVKVIVCQGPLWDAKQGESPYDTPVAKAYIDLLKEMDVPLVSITQSNEPRFNDPKLFKDLIHLNREGATLFSEEAGKQIKDLLE